MPLIQYTRKPTVVEVCDRKFGASLLKQKVQFESLSITQDLKTFEVVVLVNLKVTLFVRNDDGTYGPPVKEDKGVTSYNVIIRADNDCAVDASTGTICYIKGDMTRSQFETALGADPRHLMYQGDFFEILMDYSPIEITSMMTTFIHQANGSDFNKFS